jgi:hypothetical protein
VSVTYLPSEASVQVSVSAPGVATRITITEPKSGQTVYAGQAFWVRGTLVDQYGNPLANMTVELYVYGSRLATGRTASDGSFAFQAVIEITGTQTVTVRFPGATTATANYLPSEASVQVNVILGEIATKITITEPRSGQTVTAGQPFYVRGTLTDQYGKPLAGMTVRILVAGREVGRATTGSDGSFSYQVRIDTPGTYTITARFEGYTTTAPTTAPMPSPIGPGVVA